MRQILKSWDKFERQEISPSEAKRLFADNPYKLELIAEFIGQGSSLSVYQSGDYVDLCRGGHVDHPDQQLKHFKLLSIAGAYWRGDEKNPMLTRIYGTAWPTKKELDHYLWQLQEAKKRDHKKIGPQLELFMFHETAPGMPYWLPKGLIVLNELINFWRIEHSKRNYHEIKSPLINKKELYVTSGHWDHYRENMFLSETEEAETYALKPMNCPNAMIVFASQTRSYKDLPLRLSDTDTLHRFERSGVLNGLLRVREFSQDDAHIFVSEDQIKDEYKRLFEITERFYSIFGIEYSFRLGTRPKDFMGDPQVWKKAESELRRILETSHKEFSVLEGDGAFYGPKIDILMNDSLGRGWQMGTLQLDFQIPARFKLQYAAPDGTMKTPVVIHRVIYGSLERFMGILIEHYAGAFPVWLAPVQAAILPISEKHLDYAKKVTQQLVEQGIRVELDDRAESLQKRIRDAELKKIPYMVIIGDKEVKSNTVSIRARGEKDLGSMNLKKFISLISQEISSKATTNSHSNEEGTT
ncbi:MAG: threonine--tRNA ligase, partial [Candidatus Chisholmbacteria bacterium]|nr:threonine--tRNA ligase [Candidatus Chisholmbacteria bacterium]